MISELVISKMIELGARAALEAEQVEQTRKFGQTPRERIRLGRKRDDLLATARMWTEMVDMARARNQAGQTGQRVPAALPPTALPVETSQGARCEADTCLVSGHHTIFRGSPTVAVPGRGWMHLECAAAFEQAGPSYRNGVTS